MANNDLARLKELSGAAMRRRQAAEEIRLNTQDLVGVAAKTLAEQLSEREANLHAYRQLCAEIAEVAWRITREM